MKIKAINILSIISTLTVIGLISSDFYGGIIIYMLMYWWIIIPLLIVYAITFSVTLVKIIKNGVKSNKFLFYTHVFGLSMIIIFNLYQSELFKSRVLLDATLVDDLSSINLLLRENGQFETITYGMFGYKDKISGKYQMHNDTIIFKNRPYSNDYIPYKIIIDRLDSAIYFRKNSKGKFRRGKTFVNYFRVDKNEL